MSNHQSSLTTRFFYLGLLFLIFVSAGWVRVFDLNWDDGTHLHPDERYLTMVASSLEFPTSLEGYWDTQNSPLNPENRGYGGYVYGTLPLFAARAAGSWLDQACGEEPDALASWARVFLLNDRSICTKGLYTGYGGIHLVGRLLSTLADLLTLVALVLIAYLLCGKDVAVLSAALYAFTVLPIQHAHFFVVDSFATVFVVWTLFFATYALHKQKPWALLIAGIMTGLAVASKISTWPIAGIVGLAGFLTPRDETEGDSRFPYTLKFSCPVVIALVLSGVLAFLTFRIAQPYAFAGPSFLNFKLNTPWVESMRYIRELVSGKLDTPPGHQWTQRSPILFPWQHMVVWGMGLPLGLTAWLGWAFVTWHGVRNRDLRLLLPWVWATFFFLYQGTQWVKSMRYLLPVYPIFVLFAAWLLVRGNQRTTFTLPSRLHFLTSPLRLFARSAPGLVLAGTVLWAVAFLQIYVQPFTRIEASEWIFAHLPTAATLETRSGRDIQVPILPNSRLTMEGPPVLASVTVDTDSTITQITLNKVQGEGLPPQPQRHLYVTASSMDGARVLGEGHLESTISDEGYTDLTVPFETPYSLSAGESINLQIALLEGPPLVLETSILGNEHWDDPLPVRLEGKDPFWNWYRGIPSSTTTQMNLYDNDTPAKREQLLVWLDEVDYIILSSNRLYGSIPRLPLRYPLTVAYYRALFDGSLGFELAAEFVSFPALGSCQFPDQEAPFEIPDAQYTNNRPCSVPYPPAEEAFSVYDHPRVLIFAKTEAYSREKTAQLLPTSLAESATWMTPLQATKNPGGSLTLLMDTATRLVQEAGGTWSRLFNRDALHNIIPILSILVWWGMLTLLGWMAFPWLFLTFPALRLRGYGLSRAVGLLIWAYPAWLLASLHWVAHTRLLLWAIFFGWAIATYGMLRARWTMVRDFLQEHWRDILRIEILFAALYLGWVLVRYFNPDFYHPVSGGEKPMDFAYLNAVIRSSWFPPYDPWFSGGIMNYYYFGFVLVGSLVKALGIVPSVAYNLAVPSLLAMTGVGGYTLASNLAGGNTRRAHRAGLWGMLFTVLLGNLGELQLLIKGLAEVGQVSFVSLIPGYELLVSAAAGFWKVVVEGQELPFRPEWWYWNATRVIPLGPGEYAGPINEFPLFTFLYADLHAHMMALPLTQVALGVALQWGLRKPAAPDIRPPSSPETGASTWPVAFLRWLQSWLPSPLHTLILGSLTAGALRATNTWDYPTYLGLMGLCYLLPLLRHYGLGEKSPGADVQEVATGQLDGEAVEGADAPEASVVVTPPPPTPKVAFPFIQLLVPVLLFLLAELFFLPFTKNYAIAYTSFSPWTGEKTPIGAYFIMHGHFLLPLAVVGIANLLLMIRELLASKDHMVKLSLAIITAGVFVLTVTLMVLGVKIALVAIPLLTLAALLVLDTSQPARAQVLWLWVGSAVALTIGVELVVLAGDIGRMNTVFKFYFQVWMLLAVCAAAAVEALFSYLGEREEDHPRAFQHILPAPSSSLGDIILGMLCVLVFASALYPLFAIPAKIRDRWNTDAPPTLDGMFSLYYVTQYEKDTSIPLYPDAEMIRWMQENIEGSPTIMEMNAEVEYVTWGNRVSIYTGLPGIVGWRWHQVQQRLVMPGGTVESRQEDVRTFYNTPDPAIAREILQRYQVQYVVLSPYERAIMEPMGELKFTEMVARDWLEPVYNEDGAIVYRVKRDPPSN